MSETEEPRTVEEFVAQFLSARDARMTTHSEWLEFAHALVGQSECLEFANAIVNWVEREMMEMTGEGLEWYGFKVKLAARFAKIKRRKNELGESSQRGRPVDGPDGAL